jgi:hypothetical protein
MDHQNSGVPKFWHFRFTQIGNIRFAVVKPAHDVEREWLKSLLPQAEFLDGSCHVVKRLFDYASKLL